LVGIFESHVLERGGRSSTGGKQRQDCWRENARRLKKITHAADQRAREGITGGWESKEEFKEPKKQIAKKSREENGQHYEGARIKEQDSGGPVRDQIGISVRVRTREG